MLEHNTVKLFQQVITQAQDVVIFCAQSLQDCKTICSADYNPFRSYVLDIRITVLCTWKHYSLKVNKQEFSCSVLYQNQEILPCGLSGTGLRSRHASMGVTKILSHREESTTTL